MISRIQVATVFVSDQDKALDFYTNILGLEKRVDMPMGPGFRWVEVAPAGAETSITLSLPFDGASKGGFTGFIFDTADVSKFYETMKAKGVNFTEAPKTQPWGGIQATFTDPDGNAFLIAQRTA